MSLKRRGIAKDDNFNPDNPYPGVYRNAMAGLYIKPWRAVIQTKNGMYLYLGNYDTAEQAAQAHNAKAEEIYG